MLQARDAGVELGFFFQFGIFSYIITAILNQTVSDSQDYLSWLRNPKLTEVSLFVLLDDLLDKS